MATAIHAVSILRWVARIWSLLNLLAVLVFAVGEGMASPGPGPTAQEWVGLALWPIGVGVGLILAWFVERLGGTLALASLAGFYWWNLLRTGYAPRGIGFIFLAAPGLLFLAAGFLTHYQSSLADTR